MSRFAHAVWPRLERLSSEEAAALTQAGDELDARIRTLQGLGEAESAPYLQAAQRIADEEDGRKAGAENRATAFIAAVAALIPLMTWSISNTPPPSTCTHVWPCVAWTATFGMAVVYFVTAAYWALRTLAVANFHVIGVEDVVHARDLGQPIQKTLIQQTLLQARRNRNTINHKLDCIKVAQRRFFNGLVVLGCLLVLEPITKFGLLERAAHRAEAWASQLTAAPTPPTDGQSPKPLAQPADGR